MYFFVQRREETKLRGHRGLPAGVRLPAPALNALSASGLPAWAPGVLRPMTVAAFGPACQVAGAPSASDAQLPASSAAAGQTDAAGLRGAPRSARAQHLPLVASAAIARDTRR